MGYEEGVAVTHLFFLFVLFYEFVSFILLGNIPSWTRGYRFWFILPSNLSVSRLGKVFLRLDAKVACTTIKLAQNDIVYFKLSFQVLDT